MRRKILHWFRIRIPTVKLEIPGKSIFEIRIQNFCYIQVIVFDLSYLPVAAVGSPNLGLNKYAIMKKNVKIIFWYFKNAFPGISNFTVGILSFFHFVTS